MISSVLVPNVTLSGARWKVCSYPPNATRLCDRSCQTTEPVAGAQRKGGTEPAMVSLGIEVVSPGGQRAPSGAHGRRCVEPSWRGGRSGNRRALRNGERSSPPETGKGKRRASPETWPQVLTIVRGWLEPYVMLRSCSDDTGRRSLRDAPATSVKTAA